MGQITQGSQRVAHFDDSGAADLSTPGHAMDDYATGAAPHRVGDEPMAVEPLAFERDKNRTDLGLVGIRHHLTET
jgi:hypothetical protein